MSQMAIRLGVILILSGVFLQHLHAQVQYNQQWPGFRGPMGCGFIENAKPPVSWSMENRRNIKWKTAIPGLDHSCPVIWDKFLFVTTACKGIPKSKRHTKSSQANCTPVTMQKPVK